jgi:hypothetical protein
MASPHQDRPSQIYGFPASSHRVSAASGIVAVVLLAVSFAIIGTNFPTYDDSPQRYALFYAKHSSTIELSVFGGAAFLWFAGFLRWSYGAAEQVARGYQRATPIAFASAIAGVAVSLVYNAAHEAAVVSQGVSSPGAVRAFDLFGGYALTAAAVLLSAFLLASLFLIRVTKVLPEWLSYVAAIGTALGVVQAFLLVAPQDDNGLLGALGFAWFFAFLIFTFGASVVLTRRTT